MTLAPHQTAKDHQHLSAKSPTSEQLREIKTANSN